MIRMIKTNLPLIAVVVCVLAGGPGPRADDSSPRDPGLLVLSYHDIKDVAANDFTVGRDAFKAHLGFLKREGYRTITLDSLDAWRKGRAKLPSKPVMMTFDDGNRSDYTIAFSLLKEYGFSANLFLLSDPDAYTKRRLTHQQIKEMIQAGFGIGSHGASHRSLVGLNPADLKKEIHGSRRKLEADFGIRIQFFAYPFGNFDESVAEAVKSSGYQGAFTTIPGVNHRHTNPFEMRRLVVGRQFSLGLFKKALTGDPAFYTARLKGQTSWNIKRGMFQAARICLDELRNLARNKMSNIERLSVNTFAADAYNKMGTVLMRLGLHKEARQHFARAIAFKPDHAQARQNLDRASRKANVSN